MRIDERIQTGKSLKDLSTFGIGGPIRYYIEASIVSDIQDALHWANLQHIPYFILGNGSNCLFDDQGFNGLIIHNKIDFCQFDGSSVTAGAGTSFSHIGWQAVKKNLGGLEFARGIPGTVGGAIFMNAGAHQQEVSQTVHEVLFLFESGEQKRFLRHEMVFGHRESSFQEMPGSILSARFVLTQNPDAQKSAQAMLAMRMKTQPLKEKSAGCAFRNPPGSLSAGALIDQCGLKGMQVGGAQVSCMHANFIVNASGAKAADVRELILHVQEKVYQKTGVRLETEIRWVPYE